MGAEFECRGLFFKHTRYLLDALTHRAGWACTDLLFSLILWLLIVVSEIIAASRHSLPTLLVHERLKCIGSIHGA